MCSGKCCDPINEKCDNCCNIISAAIVLAFQIALIARIKNLINTNDIENPFLSETPFFDFELSESNIENKKSLTFFEFSGRKKYLVHGKKEEYDKKSFDTILGQKFFYTKRNKNYFDYKNNYSVDSGNNCPLNLKKCGILDSNQRILCLPVDEECPLNGFGISKTYPDSKYENYEYKKVYDSIDNSEYYIYYTNNNNEGIIITKFKLSYGTPCADNSEISWVKFYDNEIEKSVTCSREVDGSTTSDRYSKVSDEGINIVSLYKDNGLTEASSYPDINNYKIDLYIRNFNALNEEYVNDYLKEIKEDRNYHNSINIAIIVLAAISIILNIVFEVIMFQKFCCEKKLKKFIAFITPLYGIISNIINIILLAKNPDNYYENGSFNLIFSVLSLFFSLISLALTYALKVIEQKISGSSGNLTEVNREPNSQREFSRHKGKNANYQNIMHSPFDSYVVQYSRKKK